MIIKANAKINLAMDVISKKEDEHHDLDMVVFPIDLHDVLEIVPVPGSTDMYLTVDDPTIIQDETNLAYKAFDAMRRTFSMKHGYRIQIFKRIPTASGLGGASADAAGVIRTLCKAYRIPISDQRVIDAAEAVSPNIPFSLMNIPARVKGTGEVIEPLTKIRFEYGVLIVKPRIPLDSKAVFDAYDKLPSTDRVHPNIPALLSALERGDEGMIKRNMVNSLLKPAEILCPNIGEILTQLDHMGFPLYAMSGSGSACFGLTKDMEALKRAVAYFNSQGLVAVASSTKVSK